MRKNLHYNHGRFDAEGKRLPPRRAHGLTPRSPVPDSVLRSAARDEAKYLHSAERRRRGLW